MKSINSTLTVAGLVAGLLLTQIGCADAGQEPTTDNPVLASPISDGMMRGTVLETMNSGGYTYVFIETNHDRRWVAGQQTAVRLGDVVQTNQGMVMPDFTSKNLNRTFDVIYFVSALENLSAPKMPDGHPSAALPSGHPGVDSAGETQSTDVNVTASKPGQNIAYVYANKDALANQQIGLRGKVVKYNADILGWNFIHIQDGSGDATDGSNDLTVTSKATTAVGEIVVLTGTITLNKDFGYGYSFPVIMEGASLTTD